MSGIAEWKADLRAQLDHLATVFEERFGYPLEEDSNFVRDADQGVQVQGGGALPLQTLAEFYAEVGEVSLPDVHNGYFIHPASRLPASIDWGLPVRVDVGSIGDVATFGSDGGGGLFCVALADAAVYYLPPGQIVDGIYSGGMGAPKRIATDFADFLQRLLAVTREFVVTGQTVGL
jgi:hypothetical protein